MPLSVSLVDRLDSVLPQTQCRRCGYSGCRPYAEAVARGEANIDQCLPGGDSVVRDLATITGICPIPSASPPTPPTPHRDLVEIEELKCIGCTLCLQACPVDAIIGAAKLMHTVIASECTGCELCVPVCPVDCIRLISLPLKPPDPAQTKTDAVRWRRRYEIHRERLEIHEPEQEAIFPIGPQQRQITPAQAAVAAALERARVRRNSLR